MWTFLSVGGGGGAKALDAPPPPLLGTGCTLCEKNSHGNDILWNQNYNFKWNIAFLKWTE